MTGLQRGKHRQRLCCASHSIRRCASRTQKEKDLVLLAEIRLLLQEENGEQLKHLGALVLLETLSRVTHSSG